MPIDHTLALALSWSGLPTATWDLEHLELPDARPSETAFAHTRPQAGLCVIPYTEPAFEAKHPRKEKVSWRVPFGLLL